MEQDDEIVEDNDIVNACELATLEGVCEDNQDDEDCLNGIDVGVDFLHRGEAAKGSGNETREGGQGWPRRNVRGDGDERKNPPRLLGRGGL